MEILKEQYEKEIVPAMMKKFNYKSIMEVPKLDKIVINIGLGDTKENPKELENAVNDLKEITGQKPGTLFSLVRIVTTWAPFSPQLNDTLALLGRDATLARIDRARELK